MTTSPDYCSAFAETHVPSFFEVGHLPGDRAPHLHELQISENERWAKERLARVEAHARRVEKELRKRRRKAGEITNGRRQPVRCVELSRSFDSVTAAAAFVHRAPSNILQAIRTQVRCGGFHWERSAPSGPRVKTPLTHGDETGRTASAACAPAASESPAPPQPGAAGFRWKEYATAIASEDKWESEMNSFCNQLHPVGAPDDEEFILG